MGDLKEVAPEMGLTAPITPQRHEATEDIIAKCCRSGESWVAVDAVGTVVGFVLAEPDQVERFFHKIERFLCPISV